MPLQATSGAATYDAFGSAAADRVYIEDVFSTYLYTGNQTARSIVNGIDLSTKGGMIWTKCRSAAGAHAIFDTNRGATGQLNSGSTDAAGTATDAVTGYNTNGYSLGVDNVSGNVNNNGFTFASWTFRKQPKFFDVVTYTGNGTAGRTVSHNLGSVPGCIIVKRTDAANGWAVYHRSMNASPQDYMMRLNATDAAFTTSPSRWNNTLPTSTVFTLSGNDEVNGSGGTYVAYLFAHDAGGFGLSGTDNVISCGSFTTDGSTNATINLGWEPQWILTKDIGAADDWRVSDNMRGLVGIGSGSLTARLVPNTSGAENSATGDVKVFATGANISLNASRTYIYIAIRRGPMKVPTSGTSVFTPIARTGTGAAALDNTNFPVDLAVIRDRTNNSDDRNFFQDRLRGNDVAVSSTNASAELSGLSATSVAFDNNTNLKISAPGVLDLWNKSGATYVDWLFRRAPGFFDVVCYTGTGSNTTQTHNLGVVPELIFVRRRATGANWDTYSAALSNTEYLILNGISAKATGTTQWNSTSPTSTVFSIGTSTTVNASGGTYVAYLFATVAGVSKVGSYTGNGSNQTINCGFTGGARFVLIKCTDSTGDWYVWDSARGIVSGNDPHLSLNTTAAEVTTDDSVDTDSTGFIVNQLAATNINVSSASYIFLAVA